MSTVKAKKRSTKSKGSMKRRMPSRTLKSLRFSVMVVCHADAESASSDLSKTLHSLDAVSRLPSERIAVAPERTAGLLQLAHSPSGLRVISIPEGEGTLAEALNRAASQAVGEFLLFLPAGARLLRGWETKYLSLLSLGPGIVGRRWLCLHQGAVAQVDLETPDSFLDWNGMAVARRVVENLGGFDNHFNGDGLAVDFCWRARDRKVALRLVGKGVFAAGQLGLVSPLGLVGPPLVHQSDNPVLCQDLLLLYQKFPGRVGAPENLPIEADQVGDGNGDKAVPGGRQEALSLPVWLRPPYHQRPVRDGERILIHRDIGMGDILISLTAAQALKDQNPNCHIAFSTAARYTALPAHSPYIDEVLTPDQVRAGNFDREVDFEGREKFDFIPGEGRKERPRFRRASDSGRGLRETEEPLRGGVSSEAKGGVSRAREGVLLANLSTSAHN